MEEYSAQYGLNRLTQRINSMWVFFCIIPQLFFLFYNKNKTKQIKMVWNEGESQGEAGFMVIVKGLSCVMSVRKWKTSEEFYAAKLHNQI